MAIKHNDQYSEMNLQNNMCNTCNIPFITGVELSKREGMICPYCGSNDTSWTAITEDENIPEDLGCISLMIENNRLN